MINSKGQLKKQLDDIEKSKEKLAADRDRLREQLAELEDILESMDLASDDLDSGLCLRRHATDTMSMYL